jgi:hypothetical protein
MYRKGRHSQKGWDAIIETRTSAAKAGNDFVIYGTAEAVPSESKRTRPAGTPALQEPTDGRSG